jgi:hypothetical protein
VDNTHCKRSKKGQFELQELKERRTSQKLIFLYKVVEGLVPAIEPDDYLKKA